MTDLINNLLKFESIFREQTISNYENTKDFTFGSLEQHYKNMKKTISFATFMDINTTGEAILEFKKALDNSDIISQDLAHSLYKSGLHRKDNQLNKSNLVDMTTLFFNELFNYGHKYSVDLSVQKTEFDRILHKLSIKSEEIETFFKQLEQLNFLYTKLKAAITVSNNTDKIKILSARVKDYLNQPDLLLFGVDYNETSDALEHPEMNSLYQELFELNQSIIKKIKFESNHVETLTLADRYCHIQGSLSELQQKLFEKSTISKIDLSSNQKISGAILFDDGSSAFRESADIYKVSPSNQMTIESIKKLYLSSVDFVLRKKPKMAAVFKEKLNTDFFAIGVALNVINRFLDNENLVKAHLKENYNSFLKTLIDDKDIEGFDDAYTNMANKHKFMQFAYSIASNKYKHLYNDETLELLKDIYDNKIDSTQLQTFVGKKIAAFKQPSEFNDMLNLYLAKINGFNLEAFLDKSSRFEATIVHNENNILILETTNYNQMKELGSTSWCIVRDEGYYDSYTSDGDRQYIICDFNKLSKDINSMIGVTIHENGKCRTAHLKDDDYIDPSEIESFTDYILIAQKSQYPNLDELIKKRLDSPQQNKTNKFNMA